jgi:hypothetical protein
VMTGGCRAIRGLIRQTLRWPGRRPRWPGVVGMLSVTDDLVAAIICALVIVWLAWGRAAFWGWILRRHASRIDR